MSTVTYVREFVGFYTNRGPKGYVSATSREKAAKLAKVVAEPWDDMLIGEPYHRLFDFETYYVRIEPK